MSDFLSNFNKDKYKDLVDEEKDGTDDTKKTETRAIQSEGATQDPTDLDSREEIASAEVSSSRRRRDDSIEDTVIDTTYQKKKRMKIVLAVLASLLTCGIIYMIYFNAVHVKAEDFLNKPVSDARSWASDHKLKFELQQEYSMEYDANRIISQSVPEGKRIRKGKTFTIVSSTGPDPEDIIPMPDFSEMNRFEIDGWIEENKAINVNIITEFSDKVDEGNFIRLVFRDSSVTEETYRRRDSVTIYVSRGVEVFEKNIAVPDFIGKTRAEVEQWAETNSIEVTFEEEHSNEIMMDTVISQSIAAEEKIAKMDKMKVVISLGKAIVVPNFASLTMDEASAQPDLMVTVQQRYHAEVPFGGLISQSISAGTKLTDKDNLAITVIYSEGRPFLKDYRGLLEGDLPSIFYQDYQSKGANIKYTVKYVDAPEIKGTVVGMSKFNEFVPMNFTVEIRVSKNASPQSHQPQPIPPDIDFDEPIETGDELPKNKDE